MIIMKMETTNRDHSVDTDVGRQADFRDIDSDNDGIIDNRESTKSFRVHLKPALLDKDGNV